MNFYKIIIFLIVTFLATALLLKSGFLNINQIDFEKNNIQCLNNQNLLSEIKIKGENILLINEQELSKKILLKYPCVKNIFFEKNLPGKIKIILNGRKGMAIISNIKTSNLISLDDLESTSSSQAALLDWSFPSLEKENFIIDDEGLIFTQNSEKKLPVIYISEQILEIGKKIENINFNKVSLLFDKLSQMNIDVTQTKIIEHNLQINNNQKIVFSLEKDILRQLVSLHLILDKAKIEGMIMESIDLRFEKPVVVYFTKK